MLSTIRRVTGIEKADILEAIRRCAADNGGVVVGIGRFETLTGIRERDSLGRHRARWGDAVREAGFEPNTLQSAYPDDEVLDTLGVLVKELGRYPTRPELQMRRNSDPTCLLVAVSDRRGPPRRLGGVAAPRWTLDDRGRLGPRSLSAAERGRSCPVVVVGSPVREVGLNSGVVRHRSEVLNYELVNVGIGTTAFQVGYRLEHLDFALSQAQHDLLISGF